MHAHKWVWQTTIIYTIVVTITSFSNYSQKGYENKTKKKKKNETNPIGEYNTIHGQSLL